MFSKLRDAQARFEKIEESIADVSVISNQQEYAKLMKEHKQLAPVIAKFREYTQLESDLNGALEMLEDAGSDPEIKEMAEEEVASCRKALEIISEELKILLLPKDPNDDKNVVIEIRAGAGGDEAALFAYVLYRMYNMYADSKGYKTELVSSNDTELGGFREVTFMISGEGAYSRFKFESGVHRVQRVPETETSGRIHTSTATVAVLPEAEDVEIEINPSDLQIDTIIGLDISALLLQREILFQIADTQQHFGIIVL